jgi:transposase
LAGIGRNNGFLLPVYAQNFPCSLRRILLVLDNFSSHICLYTRRRAHQLGIDLVFLPVGSPDLNPIEPVWKSLRWEASPLIVESAEEFRALVTDLFAQLTDRVSFAVSWIEKFLAPYLQKLSE